MTQLQATAPSRFPADSALGVVDVIVRRVDNSGNRLVVQAAGANKIKFHTHLNADGYSFLVLMGAGDWWHLRSDGAGSWWPVGRCDTTALGRPVMETTTAFPPLVDMAQSAARCSFVPNGLGCGITRSTGDAQD